MSIFNVSANLHAQVVGTETFTAGETAWKSNVYATWPVWAKQCTVLVQNALNVACGILLQLYDVDDYLGLSKLYNDNTVLTVPAGHMTVFGTCKAGLGATDYIQVEALAGHYQGFGLYVNVGAMAATGTVKVTYNFSS